MASDSKIPPDSVEYTIIKTPKLKNIICPVCKAMIYVREFNSHLEQCMEKEARVDQW
ncbi:hypothetical protein ENBRE01_1280 [Enteropsectra breve]|nr:hypothetical protein ENBRE01_1280 [Enteropsectra breve]